MITGNELWSHVNILLLFSWTPKDTWIQQWRLERWKRSITFSQCKYKTLLEARKLTLFTWPSWCWRITGRNYFRILCVSSTSKPNGQFDETTVLLLNLLLAFDHHRERERLEYVSFYRSSYGMYFHLTILAFYTVFLGCLTYASVCLSPRITYNDYNESSISEYLLETPASCSYSVSVQYIFIL